MGRGHLLKVLHSQYFPKGLCCQYPLSVSMTVPCCYQFSSSAALPILSLSRFKTQDLPKKHRDFSRIRSQISSTPPLCLLPVYNLLEFLIACQLHCVTLGYVSSVWRPLPQSRLGFNFHVLFPKQVMFEGVP